MHARQYAWIFLSSSELKGVPSTVERALPYALSERDSGSSTSTLDVIVWAPCVCDLQALLSNACATKVPLPNNEKTVASCSVRGFACPYAGSKRPNLTQSSGAKIGRAPYVFPGNTLRRRIELTIWWPLECVSDGVIADVLKGEVHVAKVSKADGKVWSCIGPGARRMLGNVRAGRENEPYAGN